MGKEPTTIGKLNGVDVERLGETVAEVTKKPELGAFRFRARGKWLEGGPNRVKVAGFYGAGGEHDHERPFVIEADEPPVLLGRDLGPNPVEYVLAALSACVTISTVYHAAARGIRIQALETELEGNLDLRGFLGLASDVRKGYQGIKLRVKVKSDASQETLLELARMSPVLDIVSNPVPVALEVVAA